jgi:hypothetical protein
MRYADMVAPAYVPGRVTSGLYIRVASATTLGWRRTPPHYVADLTTCFYGSEGIVR